MITSAGDILSALEMRFIIKRYTNLRPFNLFSPHGIAMTKGLYFAAVVFPSFLPSFFLSFFLSSFFFRRLISEVNERISTMQPE